MFSLGFQEGAKGLIVAVSVCDGQVMVFLPVLGKIDRYACCWYAQRDTIGAGKILI